MTLLYSKTRTARMNHVVRGLFDVLFFLLIIVAPWWLALPVGLGAMLFLGAYEVVLGGILMDTLYANAEHPFGDSDLLFTALFLVAFALAYGARHTAKKHLRV